MIEHDLFTTLRLLRERRVDFIIVGGVAAVLNGVPSSTFDLDIVDARNRPNRGRLLSALDQLKAVHRGEWRQGASPTASELESPGHFNLMTSCGPMDLLGVLQGKSRELYNYEDLLPHSAEKDIGEGLRVQVLNLEMLILLKESRKAEKDLAVLPILRRTLEERKKLGYTPQQ